MVFYVSPALSPGVIALFWSMTETVPKIEFFEAMAQLIPVLVLVASFEGKALRLQGEARRSVTAILLTVVWIGVGEVAALSALAAGTGCAAQYGLAVAGAMMAGALALGAAVVPPSGQPR